MICAGTTATTVADALCGGTGSPAGGGIVAVFVVEPRGSGNVPVRLKVSVPRAGKVAMVMPAPCRFASVTPAGHTAPPVEPVQVMPDAVKPATAGSVKIEPLA